MTVTDDPTFRRPRAAWFVTLDGGIVLLAALAASPGLYGRVVQRLPLPPVKALKGLLAATAVIHLGEAAYSWSSARRRELAHRRWALQTLAVGFPSLLELRKMPPRLPPGA